jgi:TonB family protein
MRKVIVASLALFPMLLHAQANSPAQPQASSSLPNLQSRLIEPKAFGAGSDTPNAAAPLRVTTGVVAPKLTHTISIPMDADVVWKAIPDRTAVVEMIVDANGKPSDLKMVESSVSPAMDKNVLDAVSQYRFKPGTLDDAPTAVPVTLHILMRSYDR